MWVWVCNCVVCEGWLATTEPSLSPSQEQPQLTPQSAQFHTFCPHIVPIVQWPPHTLHRPRAWHGYLSSEHGVSYIAEPSLAQESRSSTLIAWHCATVSIKQDIVLNSDPHTNQPLIKLLLICVLLWQWGKNLMKGNLTLPWFYLSKCIQLTETQIVNTELQNMTGLDS